MTRTIDLQAKFKGDGQDDYTLRFDGDTVWITKGNQKFNVSLADFDMITNERENFRKLNASIAA